MAENEYHFVDRWRVEGDVKEVANILEDALALPRWWGSVYFDVKQVEPAAGIAASPREVRRRVSVRSSRAPAFFRGEIAQVEFLNR